MRVVTENRFTPQKMANQMIVGNANEMRHPNQGLMPLGIMNVVSSGLPLPQNHN